MFRTGAKIYFKKKKKKLGGLVHFKLGLGLWHLVQSKNLVQPIESLLTEAKIWKNFCQLSKYWHINRAPYVLVISCDKHMSEVAFISLYLWLWIFSLWLWLLWKLELCILEKLVIKALVHYQSNVSVWFTLVHHRLISMNPSLCFKDLQKSWSTLIF